MWIDSPILLQALFVTVHYITLPLKLQWVFRVEPHGFHKVVYLSLVVETGTMLDK